MPDHQSLQVSLKFTGVQCSDDRPRRCIEGKARLEVTMLKVDQLVAWYGESQVLHGMSFDVKAGEIVTLLGRNGAGKTTTLKCIMGMVDKRKGEISYEGSNLISAKPDDIARAGIAICPEERGIFASLNAFENLMLPPVVKPGGLSTDEIFKLFPNLSERRFAPGTKLSGGEQQMLAIARIIRTGAKFLLLDEPTEGIAPVIIQQIGQTIQKIKEIGYTILLVEQNLKFASRVADRHIIVEHGHVVDSVDNGDLERKLPSLKRYLGV
jgi:branched-chain amino acid transport system ATP-binding protein